jgi:hypothetical protein
MPILAGFTDRERVPHPRREGVVLVLGYHQALGIPSLQQRLAA